MKDPGGLVPGDGGDVSGECTRSTGVKGDFCRSASGVKRVFAKGGRNG